MQLPGVGRRSFVVSCAVLASLLAIVVPVRAALPVVMGPPETPAPTPDFTTWRELGQHEGLPQATAYALAQDRDGYVWAGTEDGLARYDGRRWRRVPIPGASHAPPHVVALTATDDGAVWAGSDLRGLLRDLTIRTAGTAASPPAVTRDTAGWGVAGSGRLPMRWLSAAFGPDELVGMAYYGRGMVHDNEMLAWAEAVADGGVVYSEALDRLMQKYIQIGRAHV